VSTNEESAEMQAGTFALAVANKAAELSATTGTSYRACINALMAAGGYTKAFRMTDDDLAYIWDVGFTAGYEECASGGQVDATFDNPYREPAEETK